MFPALFFIPDFVTTLIHFQEEVRLRIFNEHLKKQSKSALAGRRKLKHEVKLPPDAKRPTTPEKREEMRNKTTREMSKARRDLAAAKAYHEQKALARKAALQQGATTSSVAINNRSESAEAVDPEVRRLTSSVLASGPPPYSREREKELCITTHHHNVRKVGPRICVYVFMSRHEVLLACHTCSALLMHQ